MDKNMNRPRSSDADIANLVVSGVSLGKLSALQKDFAQARDTFARIAQSEERVEGLLNDLHLVERQIAVNQFESVQIQRQALLQQQIQNERETQKLLAEQRQKELKSAIFSMKKVMNDTIQQNDNLVRLFLLRQIENYRLSLGLGENEFDALSDKEYASDVLFRLQESIQTTTSALLGKEHDDWVDLEKAMKSIPELETRLNDLKDIISKLPARRAENSEKPKRSIAEIHKESNDEEAMWRKTKTKVWVVFGGLVLLGIASGIAWDLQEGIIGIFEILAIMFGVLMLRLKNRHKKRAKRLQLAISAAETYEEDYSKRDQSEEELHLCKSELDATRLRLAEIISNHPGLSTIIRG